MTVTTFHLPHVHVSARIVADDYRPATGAEEMQYAILLELRALNAHFAAQSAPDAPSGTETPPAPPPAAPRREIPQVPRATAATPKGKNQRKW